MKISPENVTKAIVRIEKASESAKKMSRATAVRTKEAVAISGFWHFAITFAVVGATIGAIGYNPNITLATFGASSVIYLLRRKG